MEPGCSEIVVQTLPTSQPQAISLTDADGWRLAFGGNGTTSAGVRVTHRSAVGSPPFWRGVNLISNAVMGLPLDVFRRNDDSKEVADRHPAQKLLKRRASPVMHAKKFRQTVQSHALIFGNGFAYIERNARQEPIELWLLDPSRMLIRYVDGELWYCTTVDGEQVKFPGRDVFHLTGLTHDGITGYSALDIFAEALGLGMAAQQFGSRFFGSGANTSGLLMVPGFFDEAKIRNTMAAWKEMNDGLTNAHKVALLQEGVQFKQMTIPPDSAQFIETRKFEIIMVADILGVPEHLLGGDTRTSHNSLEQENQSFLKHSLSPWLDTWQAECDLKLLSEREQDRGTHFTEFNREASVEMLFTEKVEGLYKQVEMGLLTINEARRKLNEPDTGEDGDIRYHPANWTVVGEEPEVVVSESTDGESNDETDDDDDATAGEQTDVLRALLTSSVSEAVNFESRKVVTAARTRSNFCGWLDTFYDDWTTTTVTDLASPAATAAKQEHATESKRQLLDVAGSSTSSTLEANVTRLVTTWDPRITELASKLLEGIE